MSVAVILRCTLCTSLLLATAVAIGQTTYRWVDPATGRTVLSDKPPPGNVRAVSRSTTTGSDDEQTLPYATRQASEKFPVVLYTNRSCTSCKQARALLETRGIPFTEKEIATEKDLGEASQLFGGDLLVPSVTVGRQNVKGFNPTAWNDLLDAAGYPAKAPYRNRPPATVVTSPAQ